MLLLSVELITVAILLSTREAAVRQSVVDSWKELISLSVTSLLLVFLACISSFLFLCILPFLFSFLFLLSASMTHFLGLGPINHRVVGRGRLPSCLAAPPHQSR